MKGIRWGAAALLCCFLLAAAGCGKSDHRPEADSGRQTESGEAAAAGGTWAAEDQDTDSESLQYLRQEMAGTSQLFAAAYLGCYETGDFRQAADLFELLSAQNPRLWGEMPFLLEIPEDRVLGKSGDLFCIVPRDPDAVVAVSRGYWDGENQRCIYDDMLYSSQSGEPLLLFCSSADFAPDTQLYISGPSGEVYWNPMTDDNGCAMPLRDDDWRQLFLDFSPYRELLEKKHRDMKGEWILPTAQMLEGSTWGWSGSSKTGLETSCRMTFREDRLSVRWNDGIDAQDHVYPDAPWELTREEGFAVLTVDFREFAGVLRYNLLYCPDSEQLYAAMDVLQPQMPIGWEPLYRILEKQTAPDFWEMTGQWELAFTEVEGDRQAAEPGTEFVSVFQNDAGKLRISLTDGVSPRNSFQDKELAAFEGEMYPGCGNDQWTAYIGYMGPGEVIYSVTLPEDGMLLMELYWESEGAARVAHKWYRRIY